MPAHRLNLAKMAKPKPIQYPPVPQNTAPQVVLGILIGLALSGFLFVSYAVTNPPEVECGDKAETEAKIP